MYTIEWEFGKRYNKNITKIEVVIVEYIDNYLKLEFAVVLILVLEVGY